MIGRSRLSSLSLIVKSSCIYVELNRQCLRDYSYGVGLLMCLLVIEEEGTSKVEDSFHEILLVNF